MITLSTETRSGLAAVRLVASYYRIPTPKVEQIARDINLLIPIAPKDIVRTAQKIGLKSRIVQSQSINRLWSVPLPVIICLKNECYTCIVDRNKEAGWLLVRDPIVGGVGIVMSAEQILDIWSGDLVLASRRASNDSDINPQELKLRLFATSVWRYKRSFANALLASLFIQIFALTTPLFFQLVVDKVLVHKGTNTLIVLVVGMSAIGIFDVMLQYLRTYVISHTATRVDAELGARVFSHLIALPISYFETRQTGHTVARMREIDTIRQFLTGQGISAIIDLVFTLFLVCVLLLYSQVLALVVIFSIPVYIFIIALVRPALREMTKEKFNRGARSQQFLVESIVGIQTIKSSAAEPMMRQDWEERLAAFLGISFRVTLLGALGQSGIQYVSKAVTALILLFGAQKVMTGSLSIGELIAFNMIAGQITQPILRLSQLWQDLQQVQISVERIGDILNTSPENNRYKLENMPQFLKGTINFDAVSFGYKPGGRLVLEDIFLTIPEGQILGIVGPSGSGKSTLTKLVQRLYTPTKGRILLDGYDVAQIDPVWLRRQIGVVLQDNILFNRTVHENIAFSNPTLQRDAVVQAAKLAGAHDFIANLPNGYDTLIEERGANLSGGQRQRIAIARALATNPRVLIFDEATSALDYESEQVIQANMRDIVRGRTVIIISHRLAAVRECDRILSVSDGRIVEDGTHEELLAADNGPYAHFWRLQMRVATGGRVA